jgi:HAE1 family hydrophobic/amphiphilic exporter-1
MTSLAFILGVTPLITAVGAGAEARKVMGMAVFAGMIVATTIGVIVIPSLFVLIERKKKNPSTGSGQAPSTSSGQGTDGNGTTRPVIEP